jgi:hypothetical protein
MHHKRKRTRNRRAGCKMCKPWKVNGFSTEREDGEKFTDHKRRSFASQEISQFLTSSIASPREERE